MQRRQIQLLVCKHLLGREGRFGRLGKDRYPLIHSLIGYQLLTFRHYGYLYPVVIRDVKGKLLFIYIIRRQYSLFPVKLIFLTGYHYRSLFIRLGGVGTDIETVLPLFGVQRGMYACVLNLSHSLIGHKILFKHLLLIGL